MSLPGPAALLQIMGFCIQKLTILRSGVQEIKSVHRKCCELWHAVNANFALEKHNGALNRPPPPTPEFCTRNNC